jgi:YaiO family outer membrane protein
MNRELITPSLLGITLIVGSVAASFAGAAEFDRVAQLGLTPPAGRVAAETPNNEPDSRRDGLKLPDAVTGRSGATLDVVSGEAGGPIIYGGTRSMPRLGLANSQVIGGLLYPLSRNWFSTVETNVDAASPLRGRGYGLHGQVHRALPGGWDVSFGLHYNTYETGSAALEPGIVAGSTSEHPGAMAGSTAAGYALRLNYRYGERNTLGVTYGSASESDYSRYMLGMYPGDGRQFGLTGEHWLTPDWAVNYGLMAQEQTGPYRGLGLRLGLRYRF